MKTEEYDIISISHFFYPRIGGLEKMAYGVLSSLSENNYSCLAIHTGEESKAYQVNKIDAISVKTWSIFNKTYPLPGLKMLAKMWTLIRNNPNATIMIYDRHLATSFWGMFICLLQNRKYVLVSQTTNSSFFKNKLVNRLGNLIDKYVFKYVVKNADRVISVSNANKKYLESLYKIESSRISVILNCFDELKMKDIAESTDLALKDKLIVFATKWIPVKNPDIVAHAFKNLSKKYPSWKFKFIGEGESIINHFDHIPFNLEVEKRFYNQKELFQLLSKSSIYINASQEEGLSLGVIESTALGCLPIISDAPSNLEISKILGTEEYVFNRNNLASLIRKIEKGIYDLENGIVNDEFRDKIKSASYKNFSSAEIYLSYLDYIKKYKSSKNSKLIDLHLGVQLEN